MSTRGLAVGDLESKLRAAVVQSQLQQSLKAEEQDSPAQRLNPTRIPRDLTNTLESLWAQSQGVEIPPMPPPTTTFPRKRPSQPGSSSPATPQNSVSPGVSGGVPQGLEHFQSPAHSAGASSGGSLSGGHRPEASFGSRGSQGVSPSLLQQRGNLGGVGAGGGAPKGGTMSGVPAQMQAMRQPAFSASTQSSGGSGAWGPGDRFRPPPMDDESMEGLSVEEWLSRVQTAAPVQLGAEYMDEDFYKGLDELSRAFNEFESLMSADMRTPWSSGLDGAGSGGMVEDMAASLGGNAARGGVVTPEQLQQQHLLLLQLQQMEQGGGASAMAAPSTSSRLQAAAAALEQQQQRQQEEQILLRQQKQQQEEQLLLLQQKILQEQLLQQQGQGQGLQAPSAMAVQQQLMQQQLRAAKKQLQSQPSIASQHSASPGAPVPSAPQQQQQQQWQQRSTSSGPHPGDAGAQRLPADSSELARPGVDVAQGAAGADTLVRPSSGDVLALLVEVAKAIVANDHPKVKALLGRLSQVASLYGDSTQRMSAYFLEGLLARLSGGPKENTAASVEFQYCSFDCGAPLLRAFEVLVSSSPYLAFGHVASNSAILETVQDCDNIHIVDFGLGHAVQWPALIQAFATRPGGAPHLTITGIDRPYVAGIHKGYCLRQAGQRLKTIAREWNLPFTFNVLPVYLPELRPEMVKIQEGETVVVNCSLRLHSLMDESVTPSNPRAAVLRTMRALNPRICTLVEQHTNHNSPFFLSRFLEALHYYSILFDSLDESIPNDIAERKVFEQQVLGRAIVNVVACEGQERTERQEPLGQWQRRVERAGFLPCPLSDGVISTATALLSMYQKKSYSIAVDPVNSLVLHWKDKPLLAMSAWVPNPYEGAGRDQ